MTKKVKLSCDVIVAAQLRQVLFDSQKCHSYEFPTSRITNIRKLIEELDIQIEEQLDTEYGTK